MSDDKRDVLEVLKFELSFLEQGGYGRSVRTPWKATSAFQDSPSCINFNDPGRPHPCSECLLTDFVPTEAREENASYLKHWLDILKSDNRAIFTAAAHAQRAADYLHSLQRRHEVVGAGA